MSSQLQTEEKTLTVVGEGQLSKMITNLGEDNVVRYQLPLGEEAVPLNALVGQPLRLAFSGQINCIHCGRKTSKSFNQGFCFPCFKKLAQCDSCIVNPERCHYFAGTCREPEWGEQHCMRDHFVYLANSSGVKVGITRGNQIPTRWMDQGAIQALPLFRVSNRLQSGLLEVVFKAHVADKTNWRAMLKGEVEALDLFACREQLLAESEKEIAALQQEHGLQAIQYLTDAKETRIEYPVERYPTKVTSFNFDKQPVVEGVLEGIKGQYLIFDTGVINIRKFTAYHVELSTGSNH